MIDATDKRPLDWMKQSQIEGMVALVVGAGSGMGAACARTFAANGGHVVVADRNLEAAQTVTTEITEQGGTAIAVCLDVSKQDDIDAAVAKTIETYGQLDVLINVAVLVASTMLEDTDFDVWDQAFHTNVRSSLALALACLPHLRKSPHSAIVHAGSLAGTHGYARSGSYGPSKGALITLSKQMALEWAVDGIRVNVVIPGTIMTPALARDLSPKAIETRVGQVPLGRLSYPSEQADAAVFLASPMASFITGQTIVVDGGFALNLYPQPMGMTESLWEQKRRLESKGT